MNKQVLEEDYLSSEYKFGFELEALLSFGTTDTNFWPDEDDDTETSEEKTKEELEEGLSKLFQFNKDEIQIKTDGSVKSDDYLKYKENTISRIMDDLAENEDNIDYSEKELKSMAYDVYQDDDYDNEYYEYHDDDVLDYPFEWASPTMQFTPQNIQRCINGLSNLDKYNIYTNSSCGFHTHLSFPHITDMDCIWLLSKLSLDTPMLTKLSEFHGITFYQEDFADIGWLRALGKHLKQSEYSMAKRLFSTEKYRNLRIHPQGTIEWRGPRDFIQTKNKNVIKDYFKLLHEFVRWISKTLNEDKINNMDKDEYFYTLYGDDYKKPLIPEFNSNKLSVVREKIEKAIQNKSYRFMMELLNNYSKTKIYLDYIDNVKLRDRDKQEISDYLIGSLNYAYDTNQSYNVKMNLISLIIKHGLHFLIVKKPNLFKPKNLSQLIIDVQPLDEDFCLDISMEIFGENYPKMTIKYLLKGLKNADFSPYFWARLLINKPKSIIYCCSFINPKLINESYVKSIINHILIALLQDNQDNRWLTYDEFIYVCKNCSYLQKETIKYIKNILISNNTDEKSHLKIYKQIIKDITK